MFMKSLKKLWKCQLQWNGSLGLSVQSLLTCESYKESSYCILLITEDLAKQTCQNVVCMGGRGLKVSIYIM